MHTGFRRWATRGLEQFRYPHLDVEGCPNCQDTNPIDCSSWCPFDPQSAPPAGAPISCDAMNVDWAEQPRALLAGVRSARSGRILIDIDQAAHPRLSPKPLGLPAIPDSPGLGLPTPASAVFLAVRRVYLVGNANAGAFRLRCRDVWKCAGRYLDTKKGK